MQEQKTYYLYRHIRLDKNEPFYIGIGTKNNSACSFKTEYARAFCTHQRNKYWYNVVTNSEYKVEIIFEHYNQDIIKQKEKEFIKLYGRKDLKKGGLVNLTNGGDGWTGVKKPLKYKYGVYTKKGNLECIIECIEDFKIFFGCKPNNITRAIQKNMLCRDFFIKAYKKQDTVLNFINPRLPNIYNSGVKRNSDARKKYINQYDKNGAFIKTYKGTEEIDKNINIDSVYNCAAGKTKTAGGFIWSYGELDKKRIDTSYYCKLNDEKSIVEKILTIDLDDWCLKNNINKSRIHASISTGYKCCGFHWSKQIKNE